MLPPEDVPRLPPPEDEDEPPPPLDPEGGEADGGGAEEPATAMKRWAVYMTLPAWTTPTPMKSYSGSMMLRR